MKQSDDLKTRDGLLGHLADTMLKLEMKKITIDDAKAQASLVKQSNNLLRLDFDMVKYAEKMSSITPPIQ